MSRFSDYPVKTFSIGFSQMPNIMNSQRKADCSKDIIQNIMNLLLSLIAIEVLSGDCKKHYGEPYGDLSALPTWYLSKMTKQHVTVALKWRRR